MKYKGIFSQDDKVISIMSCFGFLEEMKLQVSFHERTSFSQLPFLLLYAIINECMCKLGEVGSKGKRGGSILASTQQSWNSRFLILPFQKSLHRTEAGKASPSPVRGLSLRHFHSFSSSVIPFI